MDNLTFKENLEPVIIRMIVGRSTLKEAYTEEVLMKLSVILPCFNGAETIAVQLKALANQEWLGEWELIVVNNGSTDESMAIVETFCDRISNLQTVNAYDPSTARLGVAHSYNVGIQAATGGGLAFCEADDEVAPGWVAAIAEALAEHHFVGGPLDFTRLNPEWIVKVFGEGTQQTGFAFAEQLVPHSYAFGCNLGIRRSVYEAIGKLDESIPFAWDMDYCWRVQQAGFTLQHCPDVKIHYRRRHTWKEMYHQSRNWSHDQMLLIRLYQCSIGRLELPKTALKLGQHLFKLLYVFNQEDLAKWLYEYGWLVGRLQGYGQYFLLGFDRQQYMLTQQAVTRLLCLMGLTNLFCNQEITPPRYYFAFLQEASRLPDG
jgi:glycosyltransferase involved in cell wall biosynthesis